MPVIVRGKIPASDFALQYVFQTLPDVRIEIERVIESGNDVIFPLLWVRGADREVIEATLQEDPSVRDVTVLTDFESGALCWMQWFEQIGLLVRIITNSQAIILDASGRDGRWQLRVLYPDHEMVSTTHEFCDEHNLTFDIESITNLDAEPAGQYGLTDEQYRVLVLAAERGYFEIPRRITLESLASEVGVSHQALSERLRRAVGTLVKGRIPTGNVPDSPVKPQ